MNFIQKIGLAIVTCVSAISLQGCVVGEGCAIPTPGMDQSKISVDPDWVNNNLSENAFSFDCTGNAFPPPPGTKGKLIVSIGLLVKEVYLSGSGKPSLANLASLRGDALAKAKQLAKSAMIMQTPGVYDIQDINCKETYMKPPTVIGQCKVSENETGGSDVPPVIGGPAPTTTPGSIQIPLPPQTDIE